MSQLDIVGLGEVVIDWVAQIPHFPKPDEKINALSESIFPGGVTANFLVALARLGANCGFIGAVGNDPYGDFLISDFNKEKVDTSLTLKKKGKKTPVNFIIIVKGEKLIIQSPHMLKTKIDISDLNENFINKAKLLHTTMIHQAITEKAIEIAKKNDLKVSIDLESQIAERGWNNLKEMLLKADIIIPNKEGAKMITKSKTPKEAANKLIKKGIPIVIITMGNNGVLLTTKQSQKMIPAYDIKNIIDTTGAGDTFNGAFSFAYWIKNWTLEKSCKYANAAAALKIQELGARTGMPNTKSITKFLKENDESFFD